MPVIIDLSSKHQGVCDLEAMIDCLRRYGLIPLGIQGGYPEQHEAASRLQLVVFSPQKRALGQNAAVSLDASNPIDPISLLRLSSLNLYG
jgi:hypothetical protein